MAGNGFRPEIYYCMVGGVEKDGMVALFFSLFQYFFRIILFLCLEEPKVGLMKILYEIFRCFIAFIKY